MVTTYITVWLKSWSDESAYKHAISQAALYGQQLQVSTIYLVFFVETIDKKNREKYELNYHDSATGINVDIIFVMTLI